MSKEEILEKIQRIKESARAEPRAACYAYTQIKELCADLERLEGAI